MPKMTEFKMDGGRELERALKDLTASASRKVARASLRKAARPIVKRARQNVHVLSGTLKKSMGVEIKTQRGVIVARIGPRLGIGHGGRHGHLEEFGTSDTPAHPFLRPAFEEKAGEALEILGDDLGERIEKQAARSASRAPRRS